MKTKLLLFLVLITSSIVYTQKSIGSEAEQLLQDKIDALVSKHKLPGISVSISWPGDYRWNGTSGFADIQSKEKLNPSHTFFQASVTKLFVSAICLQLMEEGKLQLSDTIGKFLPPNPNYQSNVLIKNLLQHRSGIKDVVSHPSIAQNWFNYPDSVWSQEATLTTFGGAKEFNQGTSFSYSNSNFILLGWIVERIEGKSFAQVLNERIVAKLPASSRVFFPYRDNIIGENAKGWTSFSAPNMYDTDASLILNNCSYSMLSTAGCLTANPSDINQMTELIFKGTLLKKSSLDLLKTCVNVNFGDAANGYGLGMMRYVYGGKTYFGHGGDFNGFTTQTIYSDDTGITYSMAINRNNAPRGPISTELFTLIHSLSTQLGLKDKLSLKGNINYELNKKRLLVRTDETDLIDSVQLIDLQGNVVLVQNNLSQSKSIELNLEALSNGTYVVSTQIKGNIQTKKIVLLD